MDSPKLCRVKSSAGVYLGDNERIEEQRRVGEMLYMFLRGGCLPLVTPGFSVAPHTHT